MGSTGSEGLSRGSKDWIKEFTFLMWDVTIDNGSPEEFFRSSYKFAGFSQSNAYSKALWVALNIMGLASILVGSLVMIAVSASSGIHEFAIPGVIAMLLTLVYGYVFYLLTFVPPRHAEN